MDLLNIFLCKKGLSALITFIFNIQLNASKAPIINPELKWEVSDGSTLELRIGGAYREGVSFVITKNGEMTFYNIYKNGEWANFSKT